MSLETKNDIEKMIVELNEIGSSANSTIDIVLSASQTHTQWDFQDVINTLSAYFPKKSSYILEKGKSLLGVDTLTVTEERVVTKRDQLPHKEKNIENFEEIEELKKLYRYLPKSFWEEVLRVANDYKIKGEKGVFAP